MKNLPCRNAVMVQGQGKRQSKQTGALIGMIIIGLIFTKKNTRTLSGSKIKPEQFENDFC